MSTSTAPTNLAESRRQPARPTTHTSPAQHPWHRADLSAGERRLLSDLEQQLVQRHQHEITPARLARMVHGTAHLLRAAGVVSGQLAEQVEAACTAALENDLHMAHNTATNHRLTAHEGGSPCPTSD